MKQKPSLTPNLNATLLKVSLRLLPVLFLSYVCAYLDRINVGFAAKHLKEELGFSDSIYGFGAGIFFIGYALFEIPSNVLLEKIGARRWIARIMVSWGILSAAMVFVNSSTTFYVLRFFLGVAEAGFFPGIILYLTYWFPPSERGKCISRFMTAIPLSGLIGAPISGALLNMHGVLGLAGWRWLFLLEALPSIFMGIYVFVFLPDNPKTCSWLNEEEKKLLADCNFKKEENQRQSGWGSFVTAVKTPQIWLVCFVYFFQMSGLYGIGLWLPEIMRNSSHSTNEMKLGFISALPFLAGTLSMVCWGWNSDHCQERKWHLVIANLLGGIGFIIAAIHPELFPFSFGGMMLAAIGVHATFGPFWALKTSLLTPGLAAVGIALINSTGNLGGFIGPFLTGYLKELTGSLSLGIGLYGCTSLMAACLAVFLPLKKIGK